jgi:hypothetical protein
MKALTKENLSMKKSTLTSKSVDEVANDMFVWVIENEVRTYPFFSILSKRQLWFGNGPHFKNAPNEIKKGLRANLGMRIPTDAEIKSARMKYGYEALVKPWPELNRITNVAARKIMKNTLTGNEFDDVRVFLSKGYVTNDGKLDLEQTSGISVYIVFLADYDKRESQNTWIKQQAKWVGWQVYRSQMDHPSILAEKKRGASALVKLNRELLKQEEYLEIEPGVDKQEVPWEKKQITES